MKRITIFLLIFFFISRIFLGFLAQENFFKRGNRHTSINKISAQVIDNGTFGFFENNPTAINEPLYTYFVSFCYFVFGKNWIGVAIFQSLLISLLSIFIYKLTYKIWHKRDISFIALILLNVYPFYITQSVSVSDTVLFTTLLGISVYYSYISATSFKYRYVILSGVFWGLTLLTRFSGIAILFGVLCYVLIYYRKSFIKIAFPTILMVFVVLTPWVIRNYTYTSKIFISTHGAIELWMGHNQWTKEVITNNISVDIMRVKVDSILSTTNVKEINYKNSIDYEIAKSTVYFELVKTSILHDPLSVVELAPLKLLKFWSIIKNPTTNSLKKEKSKLSIIWDYFYTFYYSLLLIAGLSGIFLTRKDYKSHIFIFIFISYSLLHMLVFGFTRLRVPIDQFIIIYASYFVYWLRNKIQFKII